jgi:hypothetical protein
MPSTGATIERPSFEAGFRCGVRLHVCLQGRLLGTAFDRSKDNSGLGLRHSTCPTVREVPAASTKHSYEFLVDRQVSWSFCAILMA